MKSFKTLIVLALAVFLTSCSKADDNINEVALSESEIPACIFAYKKEHFPDHALIRVIKDAELGNNTYEVYLTGNLELDFNVNCEIIDIDGNMKLPKSVIPQALFDYVIQNYSANFITDWELEFNHQQIELDNGMELEFEMDGAFRKIDND
ncbi:PepSY-like domain-containing protein [Arenibacter sp. M-2]|uniref:PepSY-like domain-containing protein n=1 Tax=Arenibacter sp. M-2 TaxID=3053612 RepID=UPI0025705DE9|nr:PepSY-like domain-containing protein [Arenibacter sp. M-2]MDL5513920.1 PepSY-like domain-containing protein [Arenibacter sp. M-2]|tara:strand:- start:458 stop:910 length:453 start_codon:yes stop_codon:yes gene_type:complete